MHINTKQLAMLGVLLSLDVIFVVLSGMIEMSTLFLLAAASYLVGIAYQETNKLLGAAFYLASVFLCFVFAPNKLYCITYAVISLYMVLYESGKGWMIHLLHTKSETQKKLWLLLYQYVLFNVIYLPILLFFPTLLIAQKQNTITFFMFFVGGQVAFYLYDKAYHYFYMHYWTRVKQKR